MALIDRFPRSELTGKVIFSFRNETFKIKSSELKTLFTSSHEANTKNV